MFQPALCLIAAALAAAAPEPWPEVAPCASAPKGMACVEGGPTIRGSEKKHRCFQQTRPKMIEIDTAPVATVWVQTFYMDKTEVTYRAYRRCQRAGKCNKKAGPRYNDFDRPTQPIAGVSWYDAVEYCEAMGKHLPTEAEWERAARGAEGAETPFTRAGWVTCAQAVIKDASGRSCGVKKLGGNPDKGRALEVKSRKAGRHGLYDMVGNIEEWVYDWYSTSYRACGDACLGADPKGPCGGVEPCPGHEYRVVRGGSWYYKHTHATGYHRRPHVPKNRPYHHFGFRCAASPVEAEALTR